MSTYAHSTCDQCGYDISVSVDRCPECGMAIRERIGLPWQNKSTPVTLFVTIWQVICTPATAFEHVRPGRSEVSIMLVNLLITTLLIPSAVPGTYFLGTALAGHAPSPDAWLLIWIASTVLVGVLVSSVLGLLGATVYIAVQLGLTSKPPHIRRAVFAYATCGWTGAAAICALLAVFIALILGLALNSSDDMGMFSFLGFLMAWLALISGMTWNAVLLRAGLARVDGSRTNGDAR